MSSLSSEWWCGVLKVMGHVDLIILEAALRGNPLGRRKSLRRRASKAWGYCVSTRFFGELWLKFMDIPWGVFPLLGEGHGWFQHGREFRMFF